MIAFLLAWTAVEVFAGMIVAAVGVIAWACYGSVMVPDDIDLGGN